MYHRPSGQRRSGSAKVRYLDIRCLYYVANYGLVSIHVNWPGGPAGATWPTYDPAGYTEAEKSMCSYGRANFS